MHFTAGPERRGTDVRTFQHLWNLNHPGERLDEDGVFGPLTESALRRSPADGFPIDGCAVDRDADGSPEGTDCDDANPNRTPGRAETCDGEENDCDEAVDEGLTQACGGGDGTCGEGTATCVMGAWGACMGVVYAADEACDGLDNDCDGMADEDRVCEHDDAAQSMRLSHARTDVDGDGRADVCMRTPSGFECRLSSAEGFVSTLHGPDMADEDGWTERLVYGSVRMGDVDGDGLADVCARVGDEVLCWRSTGVGFDEPERFLRIESQSPGALDTELWLADVDGDHDDDLCTREVAGLRCVRAFDGGAWELDELSDAAGYDDPMRFGSIRFGDVDGDGDDDVCARHEDGVACWLSEEGGFGEAIDGPAWSDDDGFADPRYGSTLRMADVDGDGADDLCVRGPDGFGCVLGGASGLSGAVHEGPGMSDAEWDARAVYSTIRLGDVTGDGARDLCARLSSGMACWRWMGDGFADAELGAPLGDDAGWAEDGHYASVRLGDLDGDGLDDVCARDGSGLSCWISERDTRWRVASWDDAAGLADPAFATTLVLGDPSSVRRSGTSLQGGCGCRAGGTSSSGVASGLVALVIVLARGLRARRRVARTRTSRVT